MAEKSANNAKSSRGKSASSKASGSKSSGGGKTKQPAQYDASKDELFSFYRRMYRIRRFEEKAGQMYGQGLIGGFCHLYIGQEAVAIGFMTALREIDKVITAYRAHGHTLASGISPKAAMAELTGRAAGIAKGKGGSMHMFNPENGFYGGHGIVGTPVPLGTGLAFAAKYREEEAVVLTFFGDGAVNQGQVYESFNMAVLWNLPVVYVIENNQYAMGTKVDRASGQKELHKRGESLGIPGRHVDGMNILSVRAAAEDAIAHVRAGKGPLLLEVETYRYRGHSMSDPAKYRSREEVQRIREQQDPVETVKAYLREAGAKDEELKSIEDEIKKEIDEAADFAREAPEPDPDELYTDIYVEA